MLGDLLQMLALAAVFAAIVGLLTALGNQLHHGEPRLKSAAVTFLLYFGLVLVTRPFSDTIRTVAWPVLICSFLLLLAHAWWTDRKDDREAIDLASFNGRLSPVDDSVSHRPGINPFS